MVDVHRYNIWIYNASALSDSQLVVRRSSQPPRSRQGRSGYSGIRVPCGISHLLHTALSFYTVIYTRFHGFHLGQHRD